MKSVYEACYFGGLAMAILFLITAVVLFFVFKIPYVFGELTGRNARKSIHSMNESELPKNTESKKERAKYYNEEAGKIKVRQAEETTAVLKFAMNPNAPEVENTEAGAAILKAEEAKTTILKTEEEEAETTILNTGEEEVETAILKTEEEEAETAILKTEEEEAETGILKTEEEEVETAILKTGEEAATAIHGAEEVEAETAVLRADDFSDETSVLMDVNDKKLMNKVKVVYNFIEIHTEETI